MKAIVLSGGRGTRLRPITHTSAKQLVPVANKPILFYAIESIVAAGIDDIGIIVGDTAAEIQAACGDGSQWGCSLTYIPQHAPLGLAHAVKIAQPFLGDSPFVMYLGDNVIMDGITPLVAEFRSGSYNAQIFSPRSATRAISESPSSIPPRGACRLRGKAGAPKSDLALVGVYMFDSTVFTAVDALKPSARGELEITEAIQYLIDNGYKVHSHVVEGYWKDTGKLEDLLEANRIVLEGASVQRLIEGTVDADSEIVGKVHVQRGASIINSVVRGPAIIGEDTLLKNAYIGPFTAVYYGCRIESSEVEHSIVLENSEIVDVGTRIEDSLIGKNVRVSRSKRKPAALRLVLGDNSEVSLL